MSRSVTVSNINPATTERALRDFLSFCGQIDTVKLEPQPDGTQTAQIAFKRSDAAKTAVMLGGTSLAGNSLKITSPDDSETSPSPDAAGPEYSNENEVPQEHKPRRRILAELLAQGYSVADIAIDKALEVDKSHGVSSRFLQLIESIERQFKPQERAREIDTKYDVTGQLLKAKEQWLTYLEPYFDSASKSGPGVKIRAFYNEAAHTAQSVHEEAMWIKKTKATQKCTCNEASGSKCTCVKGTCKCKPCTESESESRSKSCCATKEGVCEKKEKGECKCDDEEAKGCGCESEKAQDCGCASVPEACNCPPGTCRCAGCEKNPKSANFKGCGCGLVSANCACPPGECACKDCGSADPKN